MRTSVCENDTTGGFWTQEKLVKTFKNVRCFKETSGKNLYKTLKTARRKGGGGVRHGEKLTALLWYGAVAALVWAGVRYALVWLLPFLLALGLAMLLEPLMEQARRGLRLKRGFTAAVVTLVLVGGVLAALARCWCGPWSRRWHCWPRCRSSWRGCRRRWGGCRIGSARSAPPARRGCGGGWRRRWRMCRGWPHR